MMIYELPAVPQDMPFTNVQAMELAERLKASLEAKGLRYRWQDPGHCPGDCWRFREIGVYATFDAQRGEFIAKAITYEAKLGA
jgi:hypothetical protein